MESQIPGQGLQQVEGLWFESDTIVLRADQSVFRVSKSLLAARSSVFRDMTTFPSPSSSEVEMFQGAPVVNLSDATSDVEPFLRAIFDSSYFMPPPAPIPFLSVLGILRLAHKYDVNYLFKRALLHLEAVYPSSPPKLLADLHSNPLGYGANMISFDLIALPILEQVGAVWLLPFALYSLGTYSVEEAMAAPEWTALPDSLKQRSLPLPMKQLRMIVRLHHRCINFAPECSDAVSCAEELQGFLQWSLFENSPLVGDEFTADPLALWQDGSGLHLWKDLIERSLCGVCRGRVQAQYGDAWGRLWAELPGNCRMECWATLLAERKRVLDPESENCPSG
ncbi:BTB domain-containing protein [Mycena kentingensis (nom. inval.)]|nr:BTB domain-containing protein [Mycena kentingensis (nom. inval.)]